MSLLYIQGVMFQTYPILGGAPQISGFVPGDATSDHTFFAVARSADFFSEERPNLFDSAGKSADFFSAERPEDFESKER